MITIGCQCYFCWGENNWHKNTTTLFSKGDWCI